MLNGHNKVRRGNSFAAGVFLTATALLVPPLVVGAAVFPANAWARGAHHVAAVTAPADASLPTPLTTADGARYREIFRLQDAAAWKAADAAIAGLDNKLLLGEVEAQRYLSPRYHVTYVELQNWLVHHGDAPNAHQIYELALRHRTAGAAAPVRPGTGANSREAATEIASIDPDFLAQADDGDVEGEAHAGRNAPTRDWGAGLAAWRSGHFARAGHDFQSLARSHDHPSDLIAAAAFWAARVELRTGRPELYNYWLGMAAQHPRTFYGLLARRTLGIDTYIDFDPSGFTQLDAQLVGSVPEGRRALALLQVGQRQRADEALRVLARRASPNLLQAVEALVVSDELPSLGRKIEARANRVDGETQHDQARFPLPRWKPRGGFHVDRALLYGLMRQESKFQPVARSRSGATGLMQLMPATAREVAAHSGLRLKATGRDRLTDPAINLALAQQYVLDLMNDERVNGNLFYFAVAYNRGPGALAHIKGRTGSRADPLLFVESIPNGGTRGFIHKVLTNYWIYRLRLGQPTPDLDALAAGEWPIYTALDDSAEQIARHAEN
jgi:soluble lytic murein transglycosylase-like protein